jgi:hypothetical protein
MSMARGLALRLYGLLFRLLVAFLPDSDELDNMLDLLDGDDDGQFL